MVAPTRARSSAQKAPQKPPQTYSRQQGSIVVDEVIQPRSSGETTIIDDTIYVDRARTSSHDTAEGSSTAAQTSGINGHISIKQEALSHTHEQGMEAIIRRPKELLLALNRLSELGLQNLEIPLPNIVVLGDQSAGKSSVIEAISDITVPRSSGTCTRCPLLIKSLADDEPGAIWRCKVELLKNYSYHGKGFPRALEDAPFKPWVANATPDVIPFLMVDHKDALRDAIHRAQLALLNPAQPAAKFASGPVPVIGDNRGFQCEFSPNVVSIEISGPGRINLSFYDLPGIINQTEDEDKPYLVDIVRNLAKEYIKPEEAIVLLAKSMEGDPHNSSAAKLAKDMNANHRCVGVLTKPDRVPLGDPVDTWRKMLCGDPKTFFLPLGYYVTKQPSQPDLDRGIDHARARQMENVFFKTKEPWATQFAPFKDRFGTGSLQKALSDELAGRMVKNLPTIRDSIRTQIDELDAELRDLPEPPTQNALGVVLELLQAYSARIAKLMEGEHPFNNWRLVWKEQRQAFLKELTTMQPTLHIRGNLDTGLFPTQIDLTEDSDNETPPSLVIVPPTFVTPNGKRRKVEEPTTPRQSPRPLQRQNPVPLAKNGLAKDFYLDEIRKVLDDISTSDIPGEVDPKALEHLILVSLRNWDKPMTAFFHSLDKALRDQMREIFTQTFRSWPESELFKKSWELVDNYLTTNLDEQRNTVAIHVLSVEQEKPFTGDDEMWTHNKKLALTGLELARMNTRFQVYASEMAQFNGKAKSAQELTRLKATKAVDDILRADPYRREVEVMAKIRGYYKIASLRFYDNICLSLQAKLFKLLRTSLHEELTTGLGVFEDDGRDRCKQLLEEDPQRAERRRVLLKKRQALLQGQKCLDDLMEKYQDETDGMDLC